MSLRQACSVLVGITVIVLTSPLTPLASSEVCLTSLVSCQPGWQPWGRGCYNVTTAKLQYSEAVAHCVNRGARMAAARSHEEKEFIQALLVRKVPGVKASWVNCRSTPREGGAHRFECDGDEVSGLGEYYRNWADGEPNGNAADLALGPRRVPELLKDRMVPSSVRRA
ncbi:ladderlectin-like [Patiria miniata]|uniref:C-type lectin domain-containing protein n=1 Tax=Patiria miniata TaxID=46514 RepID=A0A914A7F7_PATMI|nr:ladderlectin-like [Patiria miniata]